MGFELDPLPSGITILSGPSEGLPVLTQGWSRRELARELASGEHLVILSESVDEATAGWRFERIDAVVRSHEAPVAWRVGATYHVHRRAWNVTIASASPITGRDDVTAFLRSGRPGRAHEIVALAQVYDDPPVDD